MPTHFAELLQLLGVRADHHGCTGVVEDELDLPAEEGRIDRNGNGLVGEDGEIGHRPFRAVLGQDGHAIAGFDAGVAQRGGEIANGVAELADAGIDPPPVPLELENGRAIDGAGDVRRPAGDGRRT